LTQTHGPIILVLTLSNKTLEVDKELLEETLRYSHNWAVNRIHSLKTFHESKSVEDANSILAEFSEWIDPDIEDHDILSCKYFGS